MNSKLARKTNREESDRENERYIKENADLYQQNNIENSRWNSQKERGPSFIEIENTTKNMTVKRHNNKGSSIDWYSWMVISNTLVVRRRRKMTVAV